MIQFGKNRKLYNVKIPDHWDVATFDEKRLQFAAYPEDESRKAIPEYPAGASYHIILFKERNGKIIDKGLFSAVLIDPIEYIRCVGGNGYYGSVGREYSNTFPVFQKFYDSLDQIVNKGEKSGIN